MKSKLRTAAAAAAVCVLLLLSAAVSADAAAAKHADKVRYTNPDTGYQVMILDELDFLSESEEANLTEDMIPATEYGDVMFWSTNEPTSDEIIQAREKRHGIFGAESSGILAINDSARKVTFQSDGRIYSLVNPSYARSITDNVSHYASSGDYYSCASEAFFQVNRVLRGNAIAEPMKYISYVLIALMISFVVVVALAFSGLFNPLARKNPEQAKLVGSGELIQGAPTVKKLRTQTRAWVRITGQVLLTILSSIGNSSSSGGGSGGSSGGGGGGSSSY